MALTRPIEPMPGFVQDTLETRGLRQAYDERPPYQRNDYLLWINSAKQQATKERRMEKMLRELEAGEGYMGMKWRPRPVKSDPEHNQ